MAIPQWAFEAAYSINNQYELGLKDIEIRSMAYVIWRKQQKAEKKAA